MIENGEIEIYEYGYEVIIATIIDLAIIIIAGILSRRPSCAFAFYFVLVSVRLFSGGYHASSHFRCKVVLILILIMVMFISTLDLPLISVNIAMLFHILTVVKLSPIENSNKPLDKDQKNKFHVINLIISICWWIIALLIFFLAKSIAVTIASTGLFISLLMIIEVYKKGVKT